MLPFVVTGDLKGGSPILYSEVSGPLTKEKDTSTTYSREKPPKLYEQLLSLFQTDRSLHVIDACSGAGSCGVACLSLGVKCLILEKSRIKARLIRQRIGGC